MLTRMLDLSGSGGSGGGVVTGGSGFVAGVAAGAGLGVGAVGAEVHAANCSVRSRTMKRAELVTESNTHYIDLRGSKATSRYIQFIEIIDRANVYAVIVATIDLRPLHA
jgi:hypothetical protein